MLTRISNIRKTMEFWVLRNLPGERGAKYDRKLARLRQNIRFEYAIHISRGKTNIDLGANLGYYTKMLSKGAKKVIAFEPDPWTHEELRKNVAHLKNVRIENAAAGIHEKVVRLFRHSEFEVDPFSKSQSSSIFSDQDILKSDTYIEVKQIDFVNYLEDLDEDIGVLKIDIEGAEVDILEALLDRQNLLDRIDYIFAETHEKWIASLGLRVKRLREKAKKIARPKIDLEWL